MICYSIFSRNWHRCHLWIVKSKGKIFKNFCKNLPTMIVQWRKVYFLEPLKYLLPSFCEYIFHIKTGRNKNKINIHRKNTSSHWLISFEKNNTVSYFYKGEEILITFYNLWPVTMLRKGVYHWENQDSLRVSSSAQTQPILTLNNILKRNPPCASSLQSWSLVLHWGHRPAKICNFGHLSQKMHKKSSLEIICTYRWSNYSEHFSDGSGKTKQHINQILSK